jgi:hypothetical protein
MKTVKDAAALMEEVAQCVPVGILLHHVVLTPLSAEPRLLR